MGCVKLLKGLDISCLDSISNKYYQQIVLINRDEVDEILIQDTDFAHRISFSLQGTSEGKLFRGNESGSVYSAKFDKKEDKGIPLYTHSVQVPVVGGEEDIKNLLKQLDVADVFAAIQLKNGIVEIYGFKNGLSSQNYTYEIQSGNAGAIITLESRSEEYVPPYVYYGKGQENEHFENLFGGIGSILGGDFNDDFNNDFYITQV